MAHGRPATLCMLRRVAPQRDPQVIVHVGNMWWNPRLPAALVLPLGEPGDNSNCGGSGGGLPGLQGEGGPGLAGGGRGLRVVGGCGRIAAGVGPSASCMLRCA